MMWCSGGRSAVFARHFDHLFVSLTPSYLSSTTAPSAPIWDGTDPLFGGLRRQPAAAQRIPELGLGGA